MFLPMNRIESVSDFQAAPARVRVCMPTRRRHGSGGGGGGGGANHGIGKMAPYHRGGNVYKGGLVGVPANLNKEELLEK